MGTPLNVKHERRDLNAKLEQLRLARRVYQANPAALAYVDARTRKILARLHELETNVPAGR